MSDDYLWDRAEPADADVAALEKLLAPLAHDAPLRARRPRRSRWLAAGVAVGIAAAAAAVVYIAVPGGRGPDGPCQGGDGFAFHGRGGAIACGNTEVAAGVLPVGGSLDTGGHEAELAIANIGHAQLGAHTRVHLVRTDDSHHQLALDVGHLHARVSAPPRLFVVDTASTRVTDLGCEYSIDVDDAGAGAITVQSGQVELSTRSGAIVVAPAGTHTAILAGREPGLPLRGAADASLVTAAGAYDHGDPAAFSAVLAAASPADAITVLALAMIDAPRRPEALARLAQLVPPPAGVTVESALRTPADLAAWRERVVADQRAAR